MKFGLKLQTKLFMAILIGSLLLMFGFLIFIQQVIDQHARDRYLEEKLMTLKMAVSLLESDQDMNQEKNDIKPNINYQKLNQLFTQIKKHDPLIQSLYVLVKHDTKDKLVDPEEKNDLNTQDRVSIENDLFELQVVRSEKKQLQVLYSGRVYEKNFNITLNTKRYSLPVEIDHEKQILRIGTVPWLQWQDQNLVVFSEGGDKKIVKTEDMVIQTLGGQHYPIKIKYLPTRRMPHFAIPTLAPTTLVFYDSVLKRGLPDIHMAGIEDPRGYFIPVVMPIYAGQKQPIALIILELFPSQDHIFGSRSLLNTIGYALLIFTILICLLIYVLGYRLIRPIQMLLTWMQSIATTHTLMPLPAVLKTKGQNDEIGQLAEQTSLVLETVFHKKDHFEILVQQKSIELALTLKRFDNMFQDHAAMMYLVDPISLKFLEANATAVRFYGYTRERLLTKSLEDIHLTLKHELVEHISELIQSKASKTFEFKHILASGEIRDVTVCASIIEVEEKKTAYFAVAFDVTERVLLQKQNHQIQLKLKNIIYTAANGIITVSRYGMIQSCNPAGLKMFGYDDEEEMLNQSVAILMPAEISQKHRVYIEQFGNNFLLENDIVDVKREVIAKRKNNSLFAAYLTLSQIEDERGAPLFVAILTDLSEQKQYEQSLIEAKEKAEHANRTKDNFVAYTIHELRSPLNTILGSIEILKEELETADTFVLKYLDVIKQSSERLLRFSNDLLDISKMEAGEMTFVFRSHSLRQIVNEAIYEIDVQAQRATVQIRTEMMPHDMLECDAFRIGQVIRNFLSNALKYAPSGSLIEVQSHAVGQLYLYFSVRDQGAGIPHGKEKQIFERYVQGAHARSGTGLGLTIAKQIIDAHHGKIGAMNHPQKGAIFWFQLPLKNTTRMIQETQK